MEAMAVVHPVRAALCLSVAVSYTISVIGSSHLQKQCHYTPAVLIQYIHEVMLGLLSVAMMPVVGVPPRAEVRRLLRRMLPWTSVLAVLALGANTSFMLALRLTSTSSAVALEQLCSLFVAVLSCVILGARYHPCAILLLLVAVSGAVLAMIGDAERLGGGSADMLGDFVSLAVAVGASLYMVLFKSVFPSMTPQEFLFYFTLKAVVTVGVGWVAVAVFDGAGWEVATWPSGCAVWWLPISSVLAAFFNWSLAWTTLKLSPLTARLSLLLGIPCTFAVDVATGVSKGPFSYAGVALVLLGVVGFETASARAAARKAEAPGAADSSAAEDRAAEDGGLAAAPSSAEEDELRPGRAA